MSNSTPKQRKSWRDYLEVHPAAELFPMMSDAELDELGKDIVAHNGLVYEVVFSKGALVDGRNRLEATQRAGIELDWANLKDSPFATTTDMDPYDYVITANLHRRHLTAELKRDLIAKVLKAKPEQSNSQIAKQTRTSDKTVAKVRGKLESTSEIPKLEKTTGKDGKSRKATKPPKVKKSKSVNATPLTTTPVEIGGRLCVELIAHVIDKADPIKVTELLRKNLKSEQISALFEFFERIRDAYREHSNDTLPSSSVQENSAGSAEQSVDEVTSDAAAVAS